MTAIEVAERGQELARELFGDDALTVRHNPDGGLQRGFELLRGGRPLARLGPADSTWRQLRRAIGEARKELR
jgi:hypothetical protein